MTLSILWEEAKKIGVKKSENKTLFVGEKMLFCLITFLACLKNLDWTLIFSAIAAVGAVMGVTIALWPKAAEPDVGHLKFYYAGIPKDFRFVCQFVAKNDSAGSCSVTKVDIALSECEFKIGGSLIMVTGHRTLDSADTPPQVVCTDLPESVGKFSKEDIVILGTGSCEHLKEFPNSVEIKITFETQGKPIEITKSANVTSARLYNHRF